MDELEPKLLEKLFDTKSDHYFLDFISHNLKISEIHHGKFE